MPLEHLHQRWHFHQRMNKKVWNNINRLRNIAFSSQSKQEILDNMHPWRVSISLLYNNTFSYLLIGIAILFIIVPTIYLYQSGIILLTFWVTGIFLACYGYLSIDQQSEVNGVINLLTDQVFQFQYNIQFNEFPVIDQRNMNSSYMLARVRQGFDCLNEGNSGNTIHRFAATTWQVDGHDYPVLLFHYIAISEIMLRDAKGNIYSKKIENPRWGACVFHMPALAFMVSNSKSNYPRYPINWRSSDIQFNQKFKLAGQQELELARNLTPYRILTLANQLTHMKGTLMFHDDIEAFCYVSTQNIFASQKPRKDISDVSQLRGYLRTLKSPAYEQMQQSLIEIIRNFRKDV